MSAREPESGGSRPDETAPASECEEVLGHIEDFLTSGRTAADADALIASVGDKAPCAEELGIDELIRVLVKRSCCETAPETLRLRIHTQVRIWRSEG
ncbi:MAG: mycothiol system anti-sigma-R factor [Cellulomonadaceae bacterium]